MMHLAVAVNDPDHALSNVIVNICTRAKAYHVEPVFSDGYTFCCSPKFMGITKRRYDAYHWVLIPCPFVTKEQEAEARRFCNELHNKHSQYDWLGAISGFFGSRKENKNKWFCGELCVRVFRESVPELEKIKWATPDKVWRCVAKRYDSFI